jgi:hypothetical protein
MSMRILSRMRAAAERHPRVVDGGIAVLVGLVCAVPMTEPGDGLEICSPSRRSVA